MTLRAASVALVVAACALAACTASPPVAVERSDRSAGVLEADREVGPPDVGADRPSAPGDTDLPVVDAPITSLAWGDCERFDIPDVDRLGTAGWECATLTAPMDPFGDTAVDATVALAITRHRATGDRRGSILINPGGPGGDGLSTAWGVRGSLSVDLLRSFDIVSWDPRGVGRSTPKIDCDDDVPPGNIDFIARCVEVTGPLSGYLAAPYSAADMEAIRVALGEETLDYLGYSYGAILGATYAAALPERVGAFVLDGVTDPRTGGPDGPSNDGFPTLADDGFDAAIDRFAEICNATDHCLFSLDAATVLDDLTVQVPVLPTPDFDGPPDVVDGDRFAEIIDEAMTFAGDWELLATALGDADRGDASALAALASGAPFDDGSDGDPGDDGVGESDFSEANYMIYCADLGPRVTGSSFCDDMPVSPRPLMPVTAVELERQVLVVGTQFDPLTPGYHAPEFAEALGDATHIIWEGVGHTAFPGWTPCIDDAVDAQFLREPLPPNGTRCTFLLGVEDDETLGDELFGQGDIESLNLLESSLAAEPAAVCLAESINAESDQVISHVVLGVTSDVADAALTDALSDC
jgi:pimeloyl-ACP methyl ester carboxylesterase